MLQAYTTLLSICGDLLVNGSTPICTSSCMHACMHACLLLLKMLQDHPGCGDAAVMNA
jgi:hypothetical protein